MPRPDTRPLPSLADRARLVAADRQLSACISSADVPVFVLGEEALSVRRREQERRVAIHGGGILVSACDGARIVTGGDDGRLVATDADGDHESIAADAKRRWIDQVALGARRRRRLVGRQGGACAHRQRRGARARSALHGRGARLRAERLPPRHRALQRRHALVSECGGNQPQKLEWKGSHLAVTLSPDGRFVVTAMQESTLHGWRMPRASTCACRAIRRACARCHGARTANSSPPRAPSNSFCGLRRQDRSHGRQPTVLAQTGARFGGGLPSAPAGDGGRLRRRQGGAGAAR